MPLFTRGWVVQERVLPRRTLFFTRTEVYWECANLTACERIPTGAPYVLDNRVFLERPVQRNMWDAVVRHYTRCNLTKSRDKLVAISGIARLLYDETHDEYVAGLWRTDLKHQLLWSSAKTLDEFGKSTRPPEYRAPSCSWATIDGPIDTVDWKEGSFKIEIDDLQIKSCVKNNPFGEIESASLRISSQDQLLLGFVQPLKLDTKCSKDESSKEKGLLSQSFNGPSPTDEVQLPGNISLLHRMSRSVTLALRTLMYRATCGRNMYEVGHGTASPFCESWHMQKIELVAIIKLLDVLLA